jgi:RNA polymerase sigma factor (sigma-70 family)
VSNGATFIGGLEIRPPLSAEVELALHPVISRGRRAEVKLAQKTNRSLEERRKLLRERHAGQEAEGMLLQATCGLVRARVIERGYRFGHEELEAAGVEGLVNALHRFDPSQGNRFATYANYWITKLVNQAIQQQSGLSDTDMRLVTKYQRLERSKAKGTSKREIAKELGISLVKVDEVKALSAELYERRFRRVDLDDARNVRLAPEPSSAPEWVITTLKELCGNDFDAFWQFAFKTMSIEDIARSRGISRQAMTKRLEKCRKAVRESATVDRLASWFADQ